MVQPLRLLWPRETPGSKAAPPHLSHPRREGGQPGPSWVSLSNQRLPTSNIQDEVSEGARVEDARLACSLSGGRRGKEAARGRWAVGETGTLGNVGGKTVLERRAEDRMRRVPESGTRDAQGGVTHFLWGCGWWEGGVKKDWGEGWLFVDLVRKLPPVGFYFVCGTGDHVAC